jgi:micrococcal nuclease
MRVTRVVLFIAALLLAALLFSGQALAFTDTGNSPYQDAIDELAAREIISGYDDGTFRPQNLVWRAQFAKMITGALGIEVSEADALAPFTDLGPDATNSLYPHEYVAAAYFNDITKGRTATNFAPWVDIPRAQVITMIVRAVDEFYPGLLEEPPADFLGPWGFFDSTHEDYARKAFWNGLDFNLDHPGFTPWGKMPRGEVAQALSNLLWLIDDGVPSDLIPVSLVRVIDGDTLEVSLEGTTETVRLIGIDAPALSEPFGPQARDFLQDNLTGSEVYLELDVQERDSSNRVLAYVWYEDVDGYWMANENLIWEGLAMVLTVEPNVTYAEVFEWGQEMAQAAGLGMWEGMSTSPVELLTVHADAAGDDAANLNDEWLEFRVRVAGSLAGYTVEDVDGNVYEFPNRVFAEGDVFRLYTGSGTDTQTALYWGSASPIWDNDGDAVFVVDSEGTVRLVKGY